MSQDWDSYFSSVNHQTASVRVDLGLRASVPDRERVWLLEVRVHFLQPDEKGLPGKKDLEKLSSIEEALQAALEKKCRAAFAGCITSAGRRDFYFYAASTGGFEEAAKQALARFHGYKFECSKQEDPGWAKYLTTLHPSEEQRELIENKRQMDMLREKGDSLAQARDVSHWARFKNENDLDIYRESVLSRGYHVESESEHPDDEFRHWICVARRQVMTPDAVNNAVLQVFRASKAACGQYDGWECQPIIDVKPEVKKPWWKF